MNNLMTVRPGRSAGHSTREMTALMTAGQTSTNRRGAVIGQAVARLHGGLGFRKKIPVRSTPFSVNPLITLSANIYRVTTHDTEVAPERAIRTGDRPNSRYFRLARRHAAQGAIAGIMAVLLAAWSFTAALSEQPGWSIAAACACVLAVFITTLETSESLRCMRIANRWIRWDRELNRAG